MFMNALSLILWSINCMLFFLPSVNLLQAVYAPVLKVGHDSVVTERVEYQVKQKGKYILNDQEDCKQQENLLNLT